MGQNQRRGWKSEATIEVEGFSAESLRSCNSEIIWPQSQLSFMLEVHKRADDKTSAGV